MNHIGTKLDQYVDNSHAHEEITEDWDNQYNIGKIKANHKYVALTNGLLVLIEEKDGTWVDYFLIELNFYSEDFPDGFGNTVFYGCGASGNLKEMRHTYFRPYLFYINAKLIEEAFAELRKYFEI